MSTVYVFHGDLSSLLRPQWREKKQIVHPVTRRASIKDVIEAFGVPHTEVYRIEYRGLDVDFSFPVNDNQYFSIFSMPVPWDITEKTVLRPQPMHEMRFIVDVNVGKLARYLRMAGINVLFNSRWSDDDILAQLDRERRVLLTRDLGLLKRKQVEFGRYVRSEDPVEQFDEIVRLFNLEDALKPFSRCLECNTILVPVDKAEIIHRLEPLTRKYYDRFSLCPKCDKVYWAGSHVDGMKAFFQGEL